MSMTPRGPDRLLRHGWRSWVVLYLAWALPAVMTALGAYSIQRAAGQPVELHRTLIQQLWYFGIFATICPAIYRLNLRFPFAPGRLGVTAAVAHLIVGSGVTVGAMILVAIFDVLTGNQPLAIPNAVAVELTTPRGQFRGIVNVFYYVVVAGAMMAIRIDRQRREHESRAKELALQASHLEALVAQARLEALEMQLNPHFLFNALNGIASLVQLRRNDDAYQAIGLLGELLRETLETGGERHHVSLEAELQTLDKYLALERLRFSDRLQTVVRLPDELRDAAVPPMILQPLVENSVRHALSVNPGPCRIAIEVSASAGRLCLCVRDDGPGLPPGWTLARDAGVGLRNVAGRLAALYGENAQLLVEPAETGRSGKARGGVTARLLLPLYTPDDDLRRPR